MLAIATLLNAMSARAADTLVIEVFINEVLLLRLKKQCFFVDTSTSIAGA